GLFFFFWKYSLKMIEYYKIMRFICRVVENLRFTKNREKVFKVLIKAEKPLTIEQIKEKIREKINISTIYRAVDFLERNHYIESVSFGKTIRFFFCQDKFSHFLYCENCSNIQVFNDCVAESLEGTVVKNHDFKINSHVFYFTGLCEKCKGEK
ncbi:MAG: Fur family transcriptional regulator, partial [Thermotogota bacterium]